MKQSPDVEDGKEMWDWALEKEWGGNREENCDCISETIMLGGNESG